MSDKLLQKARSVVKDNILCTSHHPEGCGEVYDGVHFCLNCAAGKVLAQVRILREEKTKLEGEVSKLESILIQEHYDRCWILLHSEGVPTLLVQRRNTVPCPLCKKYVLEQTKLTLKGGS